MYKKTIYKWIKEANNFLYKYRYYIIASYLVLSVLFFFIQFDLLKNWDMLVRILNSNYLFHNGDYFENQRALLESFIIGIFSFVFGKYSVYAFIAFFTVIFFISVYIFSKAFKLEYVILLGILLNPFFLFYSIKNGSELPMYSFLILLISFIKLKKPIAGVFMALAFVSKYDSILFLPMALFLIDKKLIPSVKRILIFAGIALLALLPFFLYNIILYHDFLFTFFMSLHENSPSLTSTGISNAKYTYQGFYELISLIPLVVLILVFKRGIIKDIQRKKREIAIISVLSALSLFLYFFASGLYVNGLGYYRFFLLVTLSLTLLLSLLTKKEMLLFTVLFFIVSIIIAYHFLFSQNFNINTLNKEMAAAKQLLIQKYGTTNCTVQSNNWVYLNYYGISATYIRGQNYSQYPVISIGNINENYTLEDEINGVYLYTYGLSKSKCIYTPVIDLKYGVKYNINLSRENNSIGCYELYGKLHSRLVLSSCISLVKIFN